MRSNKPYYVNVKANILANAVLINERGKRTIEYVTTKCIQRCLYRPDWEQVEIYWHDCGQTEIIIEEFKPIDNSNFTVVKLNGENVDNQNLQIEKFISIVDYEFIESEYSENQEEL